MKHTWLALLTIPSIAVWVLVILGFASRTFLDTVRIPPLAGFIPLLSLVISIVLIFVFPNSKEWRTAAIINGIPFVLVLLLSFVLVG